MKALRHLNRYFSKYKVRLLLGIIIAITSRIFAVAVPKFVGDSIAIVEQYAKGNGGTKEELHHQLLINIALIIGAALIAGFFMFLMRQTFIVVSRFIEFDLKNEVYEHYQKLSSNFYKNNRIGDLMNRISEDVMKVRMYAGPALMYSVNTITLFTVVLSYMFSVAPKLTWITILPLPILSTIIYFLSVSINKRTTIVQEYLSRLTSFTQEAFSGILVIKTYQTESKTSKDFDDLSNQHRDKGLQLAKVQSLFFPLMVLLIGVSNLIVIYVGGQQYINGEIEDIGILVEFLIFVNMLTWPVATVGWVSSIIQQAEASQTRINEFLETPADITDNENAIDINVIQSIQFDDVCFSYPDTGIKALQQISFEIKNGESFGIIGKTGSGKTTILELIGRMYDIDSGQILINNIDIKKISLKSLRDTLGYIPQDHFLFSDTVANNIAFGKYNASKEDIIESTKQASVHQNIIDFKNQYDTIIGERGVTLSGGQKQRISIARALLKKPSLLMLDDCLSAVDTETENKIISHFEKMNPKPIQIIVSHRISSVIKCDRIIILESGKTLALGNHDALINSNSYYKEVHDKQLKQKDL